MLPRYPILILFDQNAGIFNVVNRIALDKEVAGAACLDCAIGVQSCGGKFGSSMIRLRRCLRGLRRLQASADFWLLTLVDYRAYLHHMKGYFSLGSETAI
jgi:hypothetical protein